MDIEEIQQEIRHCRHMVHTWPTFEDEKGSIWFENVSELLCLNDYLEDLYDQAGHYYMALRDQKREDELFESYFEEECIEDLCEPWKPERRRQRKRPKPRTAKCWTASSREKKMSNQ